MGMSTHVAGIRPPDDHWQRMKTAWDACEAANVTPPDSVLDFFKGQAPDPAGVVIPLDGTYDGGVDIAREWHDFSRSGYEIDIDELPKDVKVIRFYNSW